MADIAPSPNAAAPAIRFSAALLAGGRSTRMGRDKAQLRVDDEPLWQRQVRLLAEVGAEEILISGPANGPWTADARCRVVGDIHRDCGPLGGIHAVLFAARTPLVLVLAVDMPAMTAAALRALLAEATAETGVLPVSAGQPEPLAAIYPARLAAVAGMRLPNGNLRAHAFAFAAETLGAIRRWEIPPQFHAAFTNVNTPADLERAQEAMFWERGC